MEAEEEGSFKAGRRRIVKNGKCAPALSVIIQCCTGNRALSGFFIVQHASGVWKFGCGLGLRYTAKVFLFESVYDGSRSEGLEKVVDNGYSAYLIAVEDANVETSGSFGVKISRSERE